MVVRVEYHIPKTYFIKHKNTFKKLLHKDAFTISEMKFEKGMTELQIAKKLGVSYFKVRKILSFVCKRVKKIC